MPNFNLLDRVPGFEYDNFIPSADAMRRFHLKDGSLIIQDKEGRLFNVHPLISERYNKNTKKNESMEHSYPVRWQLCNQYDVPEEIKDKIA